MSNSRRAERPVEGHAPGARFAPGGRAADSPQGLAAGVMRLPGGWRAGFNGALAGVAVALGNGLALGLMVFAPLGGEFAAYAGLAALASAALAALVAGLCLEEGTLAFQPRASICLVQAGWLASLAQDSQLAASGIGANAAVVLALAAAPVACCGVFQLGFAALRLGTIIRFVPYPVVAGVMNGVVILVIVSVLPSTLGLPTAASLLSLPAWQAVQPAATVAGVATVVLSILIALRRPRWPSAVLALAAATALFWLLRLAGAEGPGSGLIDSAFDGYATLGGQWGAARGEFVELLARHGPTVLATGLTLAAMGSLDSLMAAVSIDFETGTRHAPGRLLTSLGLSNLAVACVGGIPVALSRGTTLAIYRQGGRRNTSVLAMAGLLAPIPLTPLLPLLPVSALAAVLLVSQASQLDRWSHRVLGAALKRQGDGDWRSNLVILSGVTALTVFAGVGISLLAGVILSIVLFFHATHRSVVRSMRNGRQCRSRRIYSPAAEQVLDAGAERIKLVELEGALFFGNVEQLGSRVLPGVAAGDFLILDLHRVRHVDASAAIALQRLVHDAETRGAAVALAGVASGSAIVATLVGYAPGWRANTACWADRDQALDWAERGVLGKDATATSREIAFEALPLLAGLASEDLAFLRQHMRRIVLAGGETLFEEGQPGDRLFLLASGSVTIRVGAPHGEVQRRIVSFAPGACFGESALLAGTPRSASAQAETETTIYELTRASFDRIAQERSAFGQALMHRLALHLAERLRSTTDLLRAIESDGEVR